VSEAPARVLNVGVLLFAVSHNYLQRERRYIIRGTRDINKARFRARGRFKYAEVSRVGAAGGLDHAAAAAAGMRETKKTTFIPKTESCGCMRAVNL
jgi:hypothetical protein